jgi:hypothetical protein
LLVHFWRVARSVRPATCDGGGGRFDPESAEGSDALSMEELQKGLRLGLKTKAFVRSPPARQPGAARRPPPPPRTKWTRRVPHPVLIGHAASLT